MTITLYTADCCGSRSNTVYPDKCVITGADALADAAAHDHVCAGYRDNRRSNGNFIHSDTIVMDLDNDHSENPADWITAEKLDVIMPDISYAAAPSRNNMKLKDGKEPRPKLHVYFPIKEVTDPEEYAALKRGIQKKYPFFDGNALDAARFVFGAPGDKAIWHEGWVNIDEDVEPVAGERDGGGRGRITKGTRNNTLSQYAARVIKRFGNADKAYGLFIKEAERCDPPLQDSELQTIWASAVRFYETKIKTGEGYVDPEEYNSGGIHSLKPDDYSDIGQARVLADEYGDELAFTNATDYLRYDGERWVEDRQLAVGAMEEFSDLQLQDAFDQVRAAKDALVKAGVPEEAVAAGGKELDKAVDTDEQIEALFALVAAQRYLAFAQKRRDYKYLTSALNAAKPMLMVSVTDLDGNEFLLNTPYATFDLRKGMGGEQPHDPRDFITKITGCSPGDDGEGEWLAALDLFFCGDAELIKYVQRVVGLAAIGKVMVETLIIAYGSGANGKSTFWNTIYKVLGTYSGKISAETLTVGCRRNVKPEMAELKGKRLIIASETEEGMRLSTGVVKQLCSVDPIQAEKKYKDPFSFTPSHLIVLYTNHLPKVGANDSGTWRRLVVIPFNAHISGKADIKNYSEYLFEHSGPAIMKWIIDGAKMTIDLDYHIPSPQCVNDAIEAYRLSNDWLGNFLDECTDIDKANKEKSGELYQEYRAYSLRNGEYTRSTTDFYAALEQAGFERHKTKAGSFVMGLSLKPGQDFM
ncbi:MAG: phage/plasmid primase, P4 family [Clostridiales bacterium]|nr:phage/plasmid primase, P4 family [Clostridiales bacterium]